MARWSAFGFALALGSIGICAAAELPRSDTDESFEVEPPLLIPNRDLEKPPVANDEATPAPIVDSEKLEKDLARAKRSATGADRLFKIGVISKADAEQRVLRVARLESDLENARLALARETLAQEETRVAAGEIAKADLAEAEAQLARAMEAAHTAAAKRERAELDFAESNLHRQQKLLALGTGRKSDVARAEQKLAELKAPKSN
jgi:outer membrane protein TolC